MIFGADTPIAATIFDGLDLTSPSASGMDGSGLTSLSVPSADSPAALSAASQSTANPVPEPGTLVLLLAAGGGLLWRVWRRTA